MPFARRRPLLRAAVVGGGAYAVGRRSANRAAQQDQQTQQTQQEQAQQAPQVPQQAPPPEGDAMLDQLSKLTALHEQGALTDAEFSAAKAKLLGTG